MPFTLGSVVVASWLAGIASGTVTEAAGIDVPAGGVSLPMLDWGGRPVVEVTINGKGPYRFILDTGAHMNVLDETLKEELGLSVRERAGMPTVSIARLGVGDSVLEGAAAAVMPLHRLMAGEDAPRGVLSASGFPGHLVTFDYPGKMISIRKGTLDAADSQGTFAYGASDELPTVPVTVAGTATRVHLDTGSPSGLILPTRFLDSLPLGAPARVVGQARTHLGESPISSAPVRGPITLGKFTLDLPEVSFSDVAPGHSPPTGNIGYQVLRDFVVTLDSTNRRVRFRRAADDAGAGRVIL